jgi:hypothetical protein
VTPAALLPTARRANGGPMPPDRDDDPNEFTRTPPNDLAAERIVLGTCLAEPAAIDDCAQILTGVTFYEPRHQQIWHALRALHAGSYPTDPVAVLDELRRRGEFKAGHLDAVYLHELHTAAIPASGATYHAGTVARLARQRRVHTLSLQLGQYAARTDLDTAGLDSVYAKARELLDDIAPTAQASKPLTLEELLAEAADEKPYDWVIPDVLERHDRIIVTGPEGGGKTTFLRQLGVQAAAGIHPFTGMAMPPVTVLHVDLENSRRQTRRRFAPLHAAAGDALHPARHYVEVRPSGIDLLHRDEHAWLLALVDMIRPDLLLTGPLYRMASGDPTEEKTAKPVAQALDRVRDRGCAIVLEAHTPHATGGAKQRPTRPYGASLWLRWPEFGIHLGDDGAVTHWRGGRDEREWPTILTRGGEWPWTPATDEKAIRWQKIKNAREEFGEYMSFRDVSETTGLARSTVQRLIAGKGFYATDWEILNGPEGTLS